MPDPSRLNPDNVRIGENLRAAMQQANPEKRRDGLTWRKVAAAIPMEHTALARAVAGSAGLSEAKIVRLGEIFETHPGNLIAGISEKARTERFPHIPAPTNRNKRDTARKGMAVSSVESLIKNPGILSSFFGGLPRESIPAFTTTLLALHEQATEIRKRAIASGTYDPATGKFKE
jgi:hypothetical protein